MSINNYLFSRLGAVARALKHKRYLLPSIGAALFATYGMLQDWLKWPDIGAFWFVGAGFFLIIVFACADRIIQLENPSPLKITPRGITFADGDEGVMVIVENTSTNKTAINVSVRATVEDMNSNTYFLEPLLLFRVIEGGRLAPPKKETFDPEQKKTFLVCQARPQEEPFALFVKEELNAILALNVSEAIFTVHCFGQDLAKKEMRIKAWLGGKTKKTHRLQFKKLDV